MLDFCLPKKKNSDQAVLQLSWQNKIRINLCCNFLHKTKFELTYVAIFHTKQNSDQPVLEFSTQNKIATYVGIFQTKQNSDQPLLEFSTQQKNSDQPMLQFSIQTKFEKRALVCEDLFQPRLVSTFLIILGSQDRTPFSKSNNR